MNKVLSVGDVVQIDPEYDEIFGGCFMVITEVKPWGLQGYFDSPGVDGLAFYRVKHENVSKIGPAVWLSNDAIED